VTGVSAPVRCWLPTEKADDRERATIATVTAAQIAMEQTGRAMALGGLLGTGNWKIKKQKMSCLF